MIIQKTKGIRRAATIIYECPNCKQPQSELKWSHTNGSGYYESYYFCEKCHHYIDFFYLMRYIMKKEAVK